MSGFFNFQKEKNNGFYIALSFIILIYLSPKYIKFLFSKGPQSTIFNFPKLLFSNSLASIFNNQPIQIKNTPFILNSVSLNQFMNNSVFLTPTIILLSLIVFITIQFSTQYLSLQNNCPEKIQKKSIIPIFIPLISLFLILIFGFTSSSFSHETLAYHIFISIGSIFYFIGITHLYYNWDTSSWLAPIISLIIGFIIKFIFDFGINSTNKYINWILLAFVFIMGINLYSSYYSYSLAINQQKICKII